MRTSAHAVAATLVQLGLAGGLATHYAGETGGIDFTDEAAPETKSFYRAVPVQP